MQDTPLHAAVRAVNEPEVRRILESHECDVNALGDHPLRTALECSSDVIGGAPCLAISTLLLAHGADVNARYYLGRTPLHTASVHGNLPLAELLISHSADVDIHDIRSGYTPLHLACEGGHTPIVRFLITHGADVNAQAYDHETPLLLACRNGHDITARVLMEHGAEFIAERFGGQSLLHIACYHGHTAVVELLMGALLAYGRDVHETDARGMTPLHTACGRDDVATALLLLKHGADVNATEGYSACTPLHLAVSFRGGALARVLLEHGAGVDMKDIAARTAMRVACGLGSVGAARCLLEYGADTDAVDNYGVSVLAAAVRSGNSALIKLLMMHIRQLPE